MYGMFGFSNAISLDLTSFDTSNVTDMEKMFDSSLATEIRGLDKLDTSNVTNMNGMFRSSNVSILNLNSFNTLNVTTMREMFSEAKAVIIDLSSFDTSKVTNMFRMFYKSSNLQTIYASDKFNVDNVTNDGWMFLYNYKLQGGAGTKYYDNSPNDKNRARIDGGTDSPGYFTLKNN